MKYKFFLLTFVFAVLLVVFSKTAGVDESHKISPSQAQNAGGYEIKFFKLREGVVLYDNTLRKFTMDEILEEKKCVKLINAGFYKKIEGKNSLIGYFRNSAGILSNFEENRILNGFVNINKPSITTKLGESSNLSFQTGPILIFDREKKNINISFDKNSRRMIAFMDEKQNMYFAVIYKKDSVFLGPTLEELSQIVFDFGGREKIDIVNAINLDGGSASFYYDGQTKLIELNFVGSYLCFR